MYLLTSIKVLTLIHCSTGWVEIGCFRGGTTVMLYILGRLLVHYRATSISQWYCVITKVIGGLCMAVLLVLLLHINPSASCHKADVFSSALLNRIKMLELICPPAFHFFHHLPLPETSESFTFKIHLTLWSEPENKNLCVHNNFPQFVSFVKTTGEVKLIFLNILSRVLCLNAL